MVRRVFGDSSLRGVPFDKHALILSTVAHAGLTAAFSCERLCQMMSRASARDHEPAARQVQRDVRRWPTRPCAHGQEAHGMPRVRNQRGSGEGARGRCAPP